MIRAIAAAVLVIALATAAGVGGVKQISHHGAKKGTVAAKGAKAVHKSAAERLAEARALDKATALDDEKAKTAPGTKALPGDTWRLGSVGTYLVGRGIPPGTYRSAAPKTGKCHWTRYRGLTNSPKDVIADRQTSAASTVKIKASDKVFATSNCENWHKIA